VRSVAELPRTGHPATGPAGRLARPGGGAADFRPVPGTCPLTRNMMMMDRAVRRAAGRRGVHFRSSSPWTSRETPLRLRAYRKLVGLSELVAASPEPAVIGQIWR